MSVRRDYKSKETWRDPRLQARLQVRRRGLLVIGLVLIGLVGSLFGYIETNKQEIAVATQAEPSELLHALPLEPSSALPPPPKPKYDFYTVLPQRKLVIPSNELQQHRRVLPQDPEPPFGAAALDFPHHAALETAQARVCDEERHGDAGDTVR